jgi:Flp pilus assembly pilin Flp
VLDAGRWLKQCLGRQGISDDNVNQKRRNNMLELMKKFMKDEEGQDLVEYALLLVFLALAAIAILPTLGSSVNKVFSQSNSALNAS